MNKQLIAVFSDNKFDVNFLKETLEHYFSSYLTVIQLSSDSIDSIDITPKAVVMNPYRFDFIKERFPQSEIITVKRVARGETLEQIITLPKGKEILVANDPYEAACDTVQNLKDMGINHIKMTPYYHNCNIDTSNFDTVVYNGSKIYCPENMKCYINIGSRTISQSTLAKIMDVYNIPFFALEESYHTNVRTIVSRFYSMNDAHNEMLIQKSNFEQVCKLSSNAILNIDAKGIITILNVAAETLLGCNSERIIGTSYRKSFKQCESLCNLIDSHREYEDMIIYIKNFAVLTTMKKYCADGENNLLVFMSRLESLLNKEEKIRSTSYQTGFTAKYRFEDIKGSSAEMQSVIRRGKYYAKTEATVLITGESGTGKELFAQSLHNESPRCKGPFVGVNFAAIPENLIESELFGYDEGAFTGAVKGGKPGLFRSAHHGTIFLDEIGDISPSMQSRLLRVLEEREIIPLGSSRIIPVDVRIICATNQNLPELVAKGLFRNDLYYRVKVLTLHVPPLRNRMEDIPCILKAMSDIDLPPESIRRFSSYRWPGNVRELKSISQYFPILSSVEDVGQDIHDLWDSILDDFFADGHLMSPQQNPEIDKIDTTALAPRDVELLRCIETLSNLGQSVGRYSLAKTKEMQSIGYTESKIKLRLVYFKSKGLITSGTTKQGVFLTELGRKYLISS